MYTNIATFNAFFTTLYFDVETLFLPLLRREFDRDVMGNQWMLCRLIPRLTRTHLVHTIVSSSSVVHFNNLVPKMLAYGQGEIPVMLCALKRLSLWRVRIGDVSADGPMSHQRQLIRSGELYIFKPGFAGLQLFKSSYG